MLYVSALIHFAFVGGGLLLASAGMFVGSVVTTGLVFQCLRREMEIRPIVRPIRAEVARQAAVATAPSVATALFAAGTPFLLQAWVGLSAVGLYYVVERARVFINEVLRAAEAPYYQAIARGGERPGRGDAYAMLLGAMVLALTFPALVAWGPKLAVVGMLEDLWPYLAVYCLALALSIRLASLYLDGQRAFGGGALLRIAATCVATCMLVALSLCAVESAYAVAIIVGELVLAVAAIAFARAGRR
jgi:hypothetical protein